MMLDQGAECETGEGELVDLGVTSDVDLTLWQGPWSPGRLI